MKGRASCAALPSFWMCRGSDALAAGLWRVWETAEIHEVISGEAVRNETRYQSARNVTGLRAGREGRWAAADLALVSSPSSSRT